MIRAWGGADMARAAEEALLKIEAVLPPEARARAGQVEVHAIATEMTPDLRARIDEMEAAIEARRRLTFRYRDEAKAQTERTVRPLGLWFWGKVWTLAAWCELRADFRLFRLDRIADATPEPEPFKPEPGKTLRDFYRTMAQR